MYVYLYPADGVATELTHVRKLTQSFLKVILTIPDICMFTLKLCSHHTQRNIFLKQLQILS